MSTPTPAGPALRPRRAALRKSLVSLAIRGRVAGALSLLASVVLTAGCDQGLSAWWHEMRGEGLTHRAAGEGEGAAFYSYVNDQGRSVYVSDPSLVPPSRDATPVPLEGVDLNVDLGNELARAIEAEYEALAASDTCAGARLESERTDIEHLWDSHGPLLVVGTAVLLLVLFTPFVVRRIGASTWGRFLVLALPLLGYVVFLWYVVSESRDKLREVRVVSDLCDEETLGAESLHDYVNAVQHLRQYQRELR